MTQNYRTTENNLIARGMVILPSLCMQRTYSVYHSYRLHRISGTSALTKEVHFYALASTEKDTGCRIRVMPDVHPGKVGTIGLTMTIGTRIIPNLIGIDIGCGMTLAQIKDKKMEFQKLDTVIRDCVPSGFHIRTKAHQMAYEFDFNMLRCAGHIRTDKAILSLGS